MSQKGFYDFVPIVTVVHWIRAKRQRTNVQHITPQGPSELKHKQAVRFYPQDIAADRLLQEEGELEAAFADEVELHGFSDDEDSSAEAPPGVVEGVSSAPPLPLPEAPPGVVEEGRASGSQSGSQAPPPDVPPRPEQPAPPWHTIYLPQGRVTWYRSGNKVEATCKRKGHGRCVLTRTCNANLHMAWKGRPLGLIAAFMRDETEYTAPGQHKAATDRLEYSSGREKRAAAREWFKTMPSAIPLLSQERARYEDEAEEPAGPPDP